MLNCIVRTKSNKSTVSIISILLHMLSIKQPSNNAGIRHGGHMKNTLNKKGTMLLFVGGLIMITVIMILFFKIF